MPVTRGYYVIAGLCLLLALGYVVGRISAVSTSGKVTAEKVRTALGDFEAESAIRRAANATIQRQQIAVARLAKARADDAARAAAANKRLSAQNGRAIAALSKANEQIARLQHEQAVENARQALAICAGVRRVDHAVIVAFRLETAITAHLLAEIDGVPCP